MIFALCPFEMSSGLKVFKRTDRPRFGVIISTSAEIIESKEF